MKKRSRKKEWTEENIEFAVQKFIQQHQRLPVAREMLPENNLPTRRTFETATGMTLGQNSKLHYPKLVELNEQRHKQKVLDVRSEYAEWTKEKLTIALEKFVQENGRLPLQQEYTHDNGLPSYRTFCKIAEREMVKDLENYFYEDIVQNDLCQEDLSIRQDEEVPYDFGFTL